MFFRSATAPVHGDRDPSEIAPRARPFFVTSFAPLRLAFEPLLATRTTGPHGVITHGFQLRLPDGPAIAHDDELLAAFAVKVTSIYTPRNDEPLQHEGFDPGSEVRLIAEDATDVGVWDSEGVRRAGMLHEGPAAVFRAGLDVGLERKAIVLSEDRSDDEGRRDGLDLVIFHPAFVELDTSAVADFTRPTRTARPRLVLVADGTGDVRWWDPSATTGPVGADGLPMSVDLLAAMRQLRTDYAKLRAEAEDDPRGFERFELEMERQALDGQANALWRRARAELGRRFTVGFLGAGMEHPVWSPAEVEEDPYGADCDIPF